MILQQSGSRGSPTNSACRGRRGSRVRCGSAGAGIRRRLPPFAPPARAGSILRNIRLRLAASRSARSLRARPSPPGRPPDPSRPIRPARSNPPGTAAPARVGAERGSGRSDRRVIPGRRRIVDDQVVALGLGRQVAIHALRIQPGFCIASRFMPSGGRRIRAAVSPTPRRACFLRPRKAGTAHRGRGARRPDRAASRLPRAARTRAGQESERAVRPTRGAWPRTSVRAATLPGALSSSASIRLAREQLFALRRIAQRFHRLQPFERVLAVEHAAGVGRGAPRQKGSGARRHG